MAFISFPNELFSNFFMNLPLESIRITAIACKAHSEKMLNPEFFLKHLLPHALINNPNCIFIEKFGPHLSLKQLMSCNFNGEARKIDVLKKLNEKWDSEPKKRMFYKMVLSIQALEKVTLDPVWEKYAAQRKHAHMLVCWGPKELTFVLHQLKRTLTKTSHTAKQEWDSIKSQITIMTDCRLAEIENYQSCCELFSQCQFYFQIEAPQELTVFFTHLWKRYTPQSLDVLSSLPEDVGEMYRLMPCEAFAGFCNSISSKNEFGSIHWWYFSQEHLQIFNSAFTSCKISSLNICLLPDIKRETLTSFMQLVQKADQFPLISVELYSPDYPDPKFNECKQLFSSLDVDAHPNIKTWRVL